MKNKFLKKVFMIVIALSFCFPFLTQSIICAEIPSCVRVVWSTINVYSDTNNNQNTQIIASFKYNQYLQTIGDSSMIGADGIEYYKVDLTAGEYEQDYGFVLKSQVVDKNFKSLQKELDSNAVMALESDVFVLEKNNYISTEEKLEAGTKVKILSGYNKANTYTLIQYQNQENEIVTAYVKTSALKTSGVSRTLIGAIIIVVTTVSLVLIIFGVKGKKKKVKI